ncbi:MAG: NAD(P)-dependent oxidoreductase [Bdellovibrionales bacterium]|jgi:dTDP-glucose 4,6-dehydratase|nr:NAD(P)-dependent oxidoreductase [Bdellovibrionales bacterium]
MSNEMSEGSLKRDFLQSAVVQEAYRDLTDMCRGDWRQLGNAHILVTGGTGFFGSWILASFVALRAQGFPIELTVLSRNPERFLARNPSLTQVPGLNFRRGDVCEATIPFSTTHVLHFATMAAERGNLAAEKEMQRTIVDGTRHMLAEAGRVGVERFLLASSGAVYGVGKTDMPVESTLRLETSNQGGGANLPPYVVAKREAERLVMGAPGVHTVIARGFGFSGPLFPLEGQFAISRFFTAAFHGLPIPIRSPDSIRSYLDGRDLAAALWRVLARGRTSEAYNVGSDESVTIRELADLIRAVAPKVGLRVPDVRLAIPEARHAPDIYRPSVEKLRNELGLSQTISLRDSLHDQAKWIRESQ